MILPLFAFVLSLIPLTSSSSVSSVVYQTFGFVVDNYSNPIPNLNLTLEYPSIPLSLTNNTNENGTFLFEFIYTPLPMLSGGFSL